jgi:hypothetical protein
MTGWMRSATQSAFVATEATAWFIVIRLLATVLDRSRLSEMLEQLEHGAGGPTDDARVVGAIVVLRESADTLSSGPSLLLVVVAAFAAVFVSRTVTQMRLGRSLGAVAGIVGSIVLLNILLHVALAGDFLVWDNSGLAAFFDDPSQPLTGVTEAREFVNDPDPTRVRGASLALIAVAFFMLWARFLYVGRGTVSFDRALRSFTVGFPVVMLAVLFSAGTSSSASIFALPYFVMAMLTLAVANAARTVDADESFSASTPWMVSALVTMGLLAAVAALFGLIAVLEVERAFTPLGTVILTLVTWVLVIVVTPVFWIVEFVLSIILKNFDPEVLQNIGQNAGPLEGAEEEEIEESLRWPSWVFDAFRLLVFSALAFGLYWVGRYLFARIGGEEEEEEYEELRESVPDSGMGGLLRNLFPGRSRRRVEPWLHRHPIYRLYARVVTAAGDRGFRRRPGETPLEFAKAAAGPLDARLFGEIADEFDRARYGRHFPDADRVDPLDRSLSEWEETHPATLELRARVAREMPEEPPPPPRRPELPKSMPPPGMV